MAMVKDNDDDSREIDTDTCLFCKGNSSVIKKDRSYMTSKELCEEVKTCAATIDWDRVFNKD